MTSTPGRRVAWWVLIIALVVATAGAATLGGWQMQLKNRQPRVDQDQVADRQAAVRAASDGAVAVLSYSPDTFEKDFAAAEAHLTGAFLDYYKQFTSQVVAPAIRQKAVKTSATVVRAGVATLTSQKGSILLFINQTTTSQDRPEATQSVSSVNVGLTNVHGAWLIDTFTPV
jgi:Mce-associated membrane protein